MGRLERERLADERRLGVHKYLVRRWTGFEQTQVVSKDWDDHLERTAAIIQGRLKERYPEQPSSVKRVKVDGVTQLLFEITLLAISETDAGRRATYRFERALARKIGTGAKRQGGFRPPWGNVEAVRRPELAVA